MLGELHDSGTMEELKRRAERTADLMYPRTWKEVWQRTYDMKLQLLVREMTIPPPRRV
jgi:hypothetical protein